MTRKKYMETHNLIDQLNHFLNEFNRLNSLLLLSKKNIPTIDNSKAISHIEFQTFMKEFDIAYQQLKSSGMTMNIWQFAELGRYEVRNCKVLCWLLDMHADHGFGRKFLINLLKNLDQQAGIAEIIRYLTQESFSTNQETLHCGNISERFDIDIKSRNCRLIIEAKVDAAEMYDSKTSQLKRYRDILDKSSEPHKCLLYLTRGCYLPLDESLHKQVVVLSWKDIAKSIRQTIYNELNQAQSFRKMIFLSLARHFETL